LDDAVGLHYTNYLMTLVGNGETGVVDTVSRWRFFQPGYVAPPLRVHRQNGAVQLRAGAQHHFLHQSISPQQTVGKIEFFEVSSVHTQKACPLSIMGNKKTVRKDTGGEEGGNLRPPFGPDFDVVPGKGGYGKQY